MASPFSDEQSDMKLVHERDGIHSLSLTCSKQTQFKHKYYSGHCAFTIIFEREWCRLDSMYKYIVKTLKKYQQAETKGVAVVLKTRLCIYLIRLELFNKKCL